MTGINGISPDVAAGFAGLAHDAGTDPQVQVAQARQVEQRADWLPAAEAAFNILAAQAPGWTITDAHKRQAATAAADILSGMFPGGIGNIENWGPWARLTWAAGLVAFGNFDFERGRFRPLRVDDGRDADRDSRRKPERQNSVNADGDNQGQAAAGLGPQGSLGAGGPLPASDQPPGAAGSD